MIDAIVRALLGRGLGVAVANVVAVVQCQYGTMGPFCCALPRLSVWGHGAVGALLTLKFVH